MKDSEDVQRLIRLKRYETPGDAYFRQFQEDFKERQRAEMLQRSARGLVIERVSLWLGEGNDTRWMVPAGAVAAAAVAAGVLLMIPGANENASAQIADTTALESSAEPAAALLSEDFELTLPKPDRRVPGLDSSGDSGNVLPATFREL